MSLPISTLIQAKKCVSLLAIIQNELTLLESEGYAMEHDLKRKSNMFKEVLDRSLERFFKDMPESAQLQYFDLTNRIESAINGEMLEIFKEDFVLLKTA